jgi:superkiller protein 3
MTRRRNRRVTQETAQGPTARRPASGRTALPLALPVASSLLLVVLSLLPSVWKNPNLFWAFWGGGAFLLAWSGVTFAAVRRSDRRLAIEVVFRKQHYLQACAHLCILLYWGWYWREVYDSAPLFAAQLAFAYAIDPLLAWMRRDTYTLGFGPVPIIFSTNLFLWFKPDWFYLQFAMVAVGFAAKELIRWDKGGRQTHIFNPSSFALTAVSLMLLLTGTTATTWGAEISTTQFNPPHIFLLIFLVSLPAQLLFGVASMTLSAVATTYACSLVYFAATGTHYFRELPIPIAVFLGMHLLFTDPSTSPRTELGRLLFGVLYGLSVVGLIALLTWLKVPSFYDKLLPVPILNLMIRGIDRAARSEPFRRMDPGSIGAGLRPYRRNLVYMGVWAVIFLAMRVGTGAQETLVRADMLVDQGRMDEAITRYREFLVDDPADAEGHHQLGVALLRAGRPGEAMSSLERALELGANNSKTYNDLGAALTETGRFQDAAVSLRRSIDLQPNNPKALNNLGVALLRAGRPREAIESLRRAVELQPDGFDAYHNLGQALAQSGQLEEAIVALRRAVELQPDNVAAREDLGFALTGTRRFGEAVASLQRAVELEPANPEPRHHLGQALMAAGRLEEAVATLQRAVELRPAYSEGRYELAHALSAIGQWQSAVAQLREALRIRPDWPAALAALAWLETTAPDALRQPTEALRLASQAADLSERRDAYILDVLAAAYAAMGRFTEASRTAGEAETLAAASPELAAQIREHLSLYRAKTGAR